LQIDPENPGMKSVLEKAEKLKSIQDKKEEDKRRAKEAATLRQRKLDEALKVNLQVYLLHQLYC
jgi:hypothetical protein